MSKKWQLSSSSIITDKNLPVFGPVKQSECRAVKGSTEFNCIIVRRLRLQPVIKMTTSSILYLLNIITHYTNQPAGINQDSPHRCQVITVRICLKWNQPQTSVYNLQSSGWKTWGCIILYLWSLSSWQCGALLLICRGRFGKTKNFHSTDRKFSLFHLCLIFIHFTLSDHSRTGGGGGGAVPIRMFAAPGSF